MVEQIKISSKVVVCLQVYTFAYISNDENIMFALFRIMIGTA